MRRVAGAPPGLVTGNSRHLTPVDGYAGIRIAVPAVFLAELDARR